MATQFLESAAWCVFHASWQASLLAIGVALVCRSFRRIPGAVRCWIWMFVFVRFLLPVVPASSVSLFNWARLPLSNPGATAAESLPDDDKTSAVGIQPLPAVERESARSQTSTALTPTAKSYSDPLGAWRIQLWLVAVVWGLGFIVLFGRLIVSAARLRRLLRESRGVPPDWVVALLETCRYESGIRRRVGLLVTRAPTAPAVAGFFSPQILVSEETLASLGRDDLRWLFLHELAHVRRWDLLKQHLSILARAIHWFNPVAWWATSRARIEIELACDEAVLNATTRSEQVAYGHSLVKIAETLMNAETVPCAVGLLLREPALTRRVRMIAAFRPRSRFSFAIGALLLGGVVLAGLTDANEKTRETASGPQPAVEKRQVQGAAPRLSTTERQATPSVGTSSGKMRVRALGADGNPLRDTSVFANVGSRESGKPVIVNRKYFCDAEGWANVELPRQVELLRIWIRKEGHVPLFAQWWPDHEADARVIPDDVTFHLEHGTRIGGIVVDEHVHPIPGVQVEVQRVDVDHEFLVRDVERAKRPLRDIWLAEDYRNNTNRPRVTDANGRWTLNNVPAGDDVQVWIKLTHPDYVGSRSWHALQQAEKPDMKRLRAETAQFVMHRGIAVTGHVRSQSGKPVSRATVVWGDDPFARVGSDWPEKVMTSDQGNYRLPALVLNSATSITVIARGWAPELKAMEVTPDNRSVDFQLKLGKTMHFKFVDVFGNPVPRVDVEIVSWRGRTSLYDRWNPSLFDTGIPRSADKNGVYKWTWAPEDPVTYRFRKEGYQQSDDHAFAADGREHLVVLRLAGR
jgi:beta-lactamase regulating signal transducer with metallopeptidase domain